MFQEFIDVKVKKKNSKSETRRFDDELIYKILVRIANNLYKR